MSYPRWSTRTSVTHLSSREPDAGKPASPVRRGDIGKALMHLSDYSVARRYPTLLCGLQSKEDQSQDERDRQSGGTGHISTGLAKAHPARFQARSITMSQMRPSQYGIIQFDNSVWSTFDHHWRVQMVICQRQYP